MTVWDWVWLVLQFVHCVWTLFVCWMFFCDAFLTPPRPLTTRQLRARLISQWRE